MMNASVKLIDGRASAASLREYVSEEVSRLYRVHGITPGLSVVLVGNDPASEVYVRSKHRQTRKAQMKSFEHRLPENVSEATLLALINSLNRDPAIDGILVQLPLPAHIDSRKIVSTISPAKDVDGFHPINAGLLATGQPALTPCTPLGCLILLRDTLGDLTGREALIIGRSNVVGKPMAQLLVHEDCTVTIAHSKSQNLPELVRQADIVVAAAGRREMVRGDWIKPGATVLDVGIHRLPGTEPHEPRRLVGDVDFATVSTVAGAVSPVPGGVGPMTIACLLMNTLLACCRGHGVQEPAPYRPANAAP